MTVMSVTCRPSGLDSKGVWPRSTDFRLHISDSTAVLPSVFVGLSVDFREISQYDRFPNFAKPGGSLIAVLGKVGS